jgi:Flp pilus assembly protein TadD
LEYRAPKSLYSKTALQDNLQALANSRSAESFPAIMIGNGDPVQTASVLGKWSESLAKNSRLSAALGALAHASWFNPADALTHSRLGYLRLHAGDTAKAIESLETAIRLNPKLGSAYANLGTLYYRRGDLDLAQRHLRRAIALGEDSASVRNNLAVVLARMGRLEEAIREVRIALSRNARDSVARGNLDRFLKLLDKRP